MGEALTTTGDVGMVGAMAILLTEIRRREGTNVFELHFSDEGTDVMFPFEHHPERSGFSGAGPFLEYFAGRTGGREAIDALKKFARGESVAFPVEVKWTGQTNKW